MATFRLALIQKPPVFLNLAASLERALAAIEAAAEAGANVIALPETWLPGYPVWLDESDKAALWDHAGAKQLYRLLAENAVRLGGPALTAVSEAAGRTGAHIVIGVHEKAGRTLYNTMVFAAPNGPVLHHRKLVPTYTERLVWGMGDGSTLAAIEADFGVLGGLICWEHWMPLARAAMHAKGEAIHIAQWPTVHEIHQVASRHYAFEGRCFVAAAGTILSKGDVMEGFHALRVHAPEAQALLEAIPGPDDRLIQRGGSAVIGPDGAYLATPLFDAPGIVTADLDTSRLAEERMALDTSGHYSRPDVFELSVDTRPKTGIRFDG